MKKRTLFLLLCMMGLLCSCSMLHPKAPMDQAAFPLVEDPALVSSLLESLRQKNGDLRSYKGVGHVKIANAGARQYARVLFAGDPPSKLRFEILEISGQPMTSIAYDGTWLYLSLHAENRFLKKRSPRGALKQWIILPIATSEIIALLSGRIPMIEADSVQLRKENPGGGYLLILENRGLQHRYEKIYIEKDMTTVRKFELLDRKAALIYQAEIPRYRSFAGYSIPQRILLNDKDDNQLSLTIERYLPDVDVDPSLFVLKKPD